MSDITTIGILTVFAAGVISFLSPCVLPIVPGYVSYMAGYSLQDVRNRTDARARLAALGASAFFVLGFSSVFVAFGASATALGQLVMRYRYEANIIAGVIIMVFGLFTMGTLRLPWLQRDLRMHPRIASGRPLGAYVLGLAFGFGWTPCIGPVLGAILTLSAVTASVSSGIALLGIYAAGLGLPFLACAAFTDAFTKRLKRLGRIGSRLQIAAGVVMVLVGLAMVTGQLSVFAVWLLNTFPVFAKIG